jgi:predicted kinase
MTKVVLMSGVSGSGKSTYARKLGGVVCSADEFFEKSGKYVFDPSLLREAHGACLRKFTEALLRGDSLIVVDNTNTTVVELAPYVALSQAYGAKCELVTILCDIRVAAARNTHGVPFGVIERMDTAIRDRKLPLFWDIEKLTL